MENSKKSPRNNPLPSKNKPSNQTRRRGASASADSLSNKLKQHLQQFLLPLDCPNLKLLVAFSGGLDSRVVLELLALLRPTMGYRLEAMHVHHGLSANADSWADFCMKTCRALGVPLQIVRVNIPADSPHGVEAAARKARYAALNSGNADYIVLAHHEGDQAETLLLQMLRGAGLKGMSAMAKHDPIRHYLRPLLDVPRSEIAQFASLHDLQWIDDESNTDISYDRNFCRHQVLPVMEQRFPAARHTLARSALHLAEASSLLDDLGSLDAKSATMDGQLDVGSLAKLSEARSRNLLRWWLSSHQQPMPNAQRLTEILNQLVNARADSAIRIAVDAENNVWLRRYRNLAYLEMGLPAALAMVWQGEGELFLPDSSRLLFKEKIGEGLAIKRLGICKLRISSRLGGERFKPDPAKPTRTLKHLLQEAHMPPWQRERLPLIYCDDELAAVPGIGVACSMQAGANETGLVITWQQTG